MEELYRPNLKAHVTLDTAKRVRAIQHTQEYWHSNQAGMLGTAVSYMSSMASVYNIPAAQLAHLHQQVEHLNPIPQDIQYRRSHEQSNFDSTTLGFYQTYLNTPVWEAGLKVTIKQGPNRVIRSVDTSHDDINAKLPSPKIIEQYRKLFAAHNRLLARRKAGEEPKEAEEADGANLVRKIARIKAPAKRTTKAAAGLLSDKMRLIRGRFWIYQYDDEARVYDSGKPVIERVNRKLAQKKRKLKIVAKEADHHDNPTLPIGEVDKGIVDGEHYFVAEITFELAGDFDQVGVWRALIELETGSVLYLRAMSSNVDGLVFEQDPITKTGNTALDSDSNSATLNPHRDDVTLLGLDAPVGGTQSLKGEYVEVKNVEGLNPAVPTEPTGTDFDYDARTNDFAAVSAYFHDDQIFRYIESLGWSPISDFFGNTNFPVSTDHRCWSGNTINAHCVGDGLGGIGHVGYGLMDNTDTTNPLGRACDPRVHWHELCGHGILYEYVDTANFGFAHSAGDGISGIFFDPESNCWGVDGTAVNKPGDLRFTYVPWHPSLHRRFDRDVAAGWAWGGSQDNSGYKSEEILATTHFNIYRSIGGDSTHLSRRQFAKRMTHYLILRAIQNLTPAANPNYARDFAAELMAVDLLNWTSEGVYGGAYNKVIRWAFEQQGEYQTPLITNGGPGDGSVTTPGDPPNVDVYIDDGRAGGYAFQQVHWNTQTIWNRTTADGLTGHQEPILTATNYAYVKIKNRGTQIANNVVVKGYHTKPGAGLLWPGDFEAFTTAQIAVGTVGANDSEEKIVGPFEWTPNINAYGHDCMLMIVSADGDPANVDNFTAGEVIPEWRLVPNDNNVGQRNVHPVPGGGGSEGLMAGLSGMKMWVGNPNPGRATMELSLDLPAWLTRTGWRLTVEGVSNNSFQLASGQRRELVLKLDPGANFTKDQVENSGDRDINVLVLADGNPMGGMTYHLDPNISRPINSIDPRDRCCSDQAKALLDCLGVKGQDVKKANIKEIIIGVKLNEDDCC